MLHWKKPSREETAAFLLAQSTESFPYPHVRATYGKRNKAELQQVFAKEKDPIEVEHHRMLLGKGSETFYKAKEALATWKMFEVPWVELLYPDSPIREGETVGILILSMGVYTLSACRIIYTVDEGEEDCSACQRFGFAYGTLPCHLVGGEDRFLIEWDRSDDSVWYERLSFSTPQHWLAKLGYPVARWYQKHFAKDSDRAMFLRVNRLEGAGECEEEDVWGSEGPAMEGAGGGKAFDL
ncbi:DUF1990 domain-containing protein [Balamuthia mandrillaris]